MNEQIVRYVSDYLVKINRSIGVSVEFKYRIKKEGKFPISREGNDIIIVPNFFWHEKISEPQRKMMIILLYSAIYMSRKRKVHPVNPELLAKGICDLLGEKYIPFYKIENVLRTIRVRLYNDNEFLSYFSVGDIVRLDIRNKYQVIDIKKSNNHVSIVAKPYGYNAQSAEEPITFEESKLYKIYSKNIDYSDYNVDLRTNLFIMSAPSGTGKNAVYNALKERIPEIEKVVTATTRNPRNGEINGVDYYFLTHEDFETKSCRGDFIEKSYYDDAYYATPYKEIDKYSITTPLFLIVDTNGMRNIMLRYPLSTSIFLLPPSLKELEKRIIDRGENTEEEIANRFKEASREIQCAELYDYIVENNDFESCVDNIEKIVLEHKKFI